MTTTSALRTVGRIQLDEPVVTLTAAADGTLYVGGSEGAVTVLDSGGEVLARHDLGDQLLALTVSLDSSRLTAVGMSRRRLWTVADGRLLADTGSAWSAAAAWDQACGSLAVADGRHVRVLDREGALVWSSPPLTSTVTDLLWVRGGRRIAAAAYQGVTVFEPESDRMISRLRAPGAISGIAASPNGRWVVGGSQDATLHGWKLADGSDFRMYGFPGTVSRLAFESGGRWMACDSAEMLVCWDFSGSGPTGRAAVSLPGHQQPITAFAWLPGSRCTLISGDVGGAVRTWRLPAGTKPGDELRPLDSIDGDDPVSAITADGNRAYVGRRSGRIDVVAIDAL